MDLTRALAWLDDHINHESASGAAIAAGSVDGLSLGPMSRFCAAMGDPQLTYPTIHVTGTNGKGSVVAIVESLLMTTGLSVGATTSPHLATLNERIRRNGQPIVDDELAALLAELADIELVTGERLSWFELVCAAAFSWFSTEGVDAAVVEVGLLGRFDATNVVDSAVSVITNVGRDHTDGAPGWDRRVAWEKAGIVTPGADAVVGRLSGDLVEIVAAEHPGRLLRLGDDVDVGDVRPAVGGQVVDVTTPWARHADVFVPLHGRGQADNAALAITAVEAFFDRALADDVIESAIGSTVVPGRCEVIAHRPLIVLDGAHNRDAASSLVETLGSELTVIGARIAVVGMLAGRDPHDVLEPLAEWGVDLVVCCTAPGTRGMPAEVIATAATALGLPSRRHPDPAEAVLAALAHATTDDVVVVVGSFTLIEPARAATTDFLERRRPA